MINFKSNTILTALSSLILSIITCIIFSFFSLAYIFANLACEFNDTFGLIIYLIFLVPIILLFSNIVLNNMNKFLKKLNLIGCSKYSYSIFICIWYILYFSFSYIFILSIYYLTNILNLDTFSINLISLLYAIIDMPFIFNIRFIIAILLVFSIYRKFKTLNY